MGVASYYICLVLIGPEVKDLAWLESECTSYLQRALPPILTTWDIEQWRSRSSVELITATKVAKLQKQFAANDKYLGEFKGMDKPTGRVVVDNTGGINETIGFYSTRARFDVGSADISLKLVKRGGGWKFQKFYIRTDVLEPE
jgi:hypothetical protein